MPDKNVADWTTQPEDFTNALQFLHDQKSRVGDGGNFDKTMAENWPPQAGGPKTANSSMTKWKAVHGDMAQFLSDDNFQLQARKLHEYILQAKQKWYPGMLGWTYTNELGFNVTDDDLDMWKNFAKAHQHFKPFATCGWIHFKMVDEIISSPAHGCYVFHGRATQPADPAPVPQRSPRTTTMNSLQTPLSCSRTGPNPTMASPSLPTSSSPRFPLSLLKPLLLIVFPPPFLPHRLLLRSDAIWRHQGSLEQQVH
ncbi:hypothetical protein B0H10DRAFT_1937637 [Mycena sp. CBHHK59/15]|nr:hypothetical protein B0H10DRAFT_1937637 [Mycena sp. CBHHK59/15]